VSQEEERKKRKQAIIGSIVVISFVVLFMIALVLSIAHAFGQTQEDQIKDYVTEKASEAFDKMTEDIDFEKGNFLNTNQNETDTLFSSLQVWFDDIWKVLFSTRDVAEAGIKFVAPFEVNAMIIFGVSVVLAISFFFVIIKRMAWHIFIIILAVLAISAIIIFFKLNS